MPKSVFKPVKLPNGSIVVNERCVCGKLRTDHGSTITPGHGPCVESGCAAFTWKEFVIAGKEYLPKGA
jgi:hypothetical protein